MSAELLLLDWWRRHPPELHLQYGGQTPAEVLAVLDSSVAALRRRQTNRARGLSVPERIELGRTALAALALRPLVAGAAEGWTFPKEETRRG
ncbi:MAG TPA: hypothetical protein VLC09_00760 [Polyangiaceae bacterium]|nr:hypothetical protein [Polyangiaceae bacterium]